MGSPEAALWKVLVKILSITANRGRTDSVQARLLGSTGGDSRSAAAAWVTYGEGKKDEALRLMRSAADQEDASQKDVAMENRLWPMRELLGELLLGMNNREGS